MSQTLIICPGVLFCSPLIAGLAANALIITPFPHTSSGKISVGCGILSHNNQVVGRQVGAATYLYSTESGVM
jgi:hypothetical protein